ncbi:MAG: phosphotransferase [Acidobacteriota bacterium]
MLPQVLQSIRPGFRPVLERRPPRLEADDARELAARLYGIEASVAGLPSYYDQNFLLTQGARQWVLKISRQDADPAVLEMQNLAMRRIAERTRSFTIARVCPAVTGESIPTIRAADGRCHHVRLLTYLPGSPWSRLPAHSDDLLRQLGHAVGRLGEALKDFSHPAMHCDDDWDLKHFPRVLGYLEALGSRDRQATVLRWVEHFETQLAPQLGTLPQAVIHGDLNNDNVLVDRDRIVGVIDFGDVVFSTGLFDLAIAMAYGMLHQADPYAAGCQILKGYETISPLTSRQRETAFDLACCRLVTSATYGTYFSSLEPGNTYIGCNVEASWQTLELLASRPNPT